MTYFLIFFFLTVRLFVVLASTALTSDEAVMEESGIPSLSIPRGFMQPRRIVKIDEVYIRAEGPILPAFTSMKRPGVFLLSQMES